MIERHQDYQLNLATLPAGGLENVELQLDTDAAFCARSVKQRWTPTAAAGQWAFRFRTPRGALQSDGYRSDVFGLGTLDQGNPLYPQMTYPAGGSILVDIDNLAGEQLTNLKLLFRGSKQYPNGSIENYTYPAPPKQISLLPFVYAVPGQLGTTINVPQNAGAGVLNNQLLVQTDSDFALRYAWADSFALTDGYNSTYDQLYVTIRDQWNKAYSNVPIHIDDLFGSSNSVATGSQQDAFFRPGIFTPEIYIPANGQLYFDLFRNDSAGGTVTLQFSFGGVKVYHR